MTGRDGGTRVANFTYDALNRVSQITRPGIGTLATYSYNAVGNRTQTQRANGITSVYGYDDLHRLTGIEHKKGTETLSQFAYALNNDGQRGTLTEYVKYPEGQTVASINRTVHYGYDNAGRLIGEQRLSHQTLAAGGSIDKTAHTVWTYDKANNRTTQSLSNYDGLGTGTTSVLTSTHATQYNYNSNDWLQNQTSEHTTSTTSNTYTTNYEYNGNGSQSAVTTNVGTPDQKRVPYFYDFEEKLIGIGNPADTTKHAYAYDADGNRVTETNYVSGTPATKHYLIDPNVSHAQVVEEFDSANQLLAHHDWDDAELLRSAVADSEGNAHITQPLADGHNSTRQLMDATGSIGGVLGYDAWGNAQEGIGISTAYRYNGQRLDASGLYHLRARQYAPWTGRFLSHDPILGDTNNPITQHRYLYAGKDPVNYVDPGGESYSISGLAISLTLTIAYAQMPAQTPMTAGDIASPPFGGFVGQVVIGEIASIPIALAGKYAVILIRSKISSIFTDVADDVVEDAVASQTRFIGALKNRAQLLKRQLELGKNHEQGNIIDYAEGLGGARYELATGRTLSRKEVEGVDFYFKHTPISLKGPLGVNSKTGALISITDDMIEGLIDAAVHDITTKTATKRILVDLYRLTENQQAHVMEEVLKRAPNPKKQIEFIR